MAFGVIVSAHTWAMNLDKSIQETLRPVAIHIGLSQSNTSDTTDRKAIYSNLIQARAVTESHLVKLALDQLLTRIQAVIDRVESNAVWAPSAIVAGALAEAYTP